MFYKIFILIFLPLIGCFYPIAVIPGFMGDCKNESMKQFINEIE